MGARELDLINMIDLGFTPRACCWVHRRGQAQALLAVCVTRGFRLYFEHVLDLCTGPRGMHRQFAYTMAEVRKRPSIRLKSSTNRQCTSSPYVFLSPLSGYSTEPLSRPSIVLRHPRHRPLRGYLGLPRVLATARTLGAAYSPGILVLQVVDGPIRVQKVAHDSDQHHPLARPDAIRRTERDRPADPRVQLPEREDDAQVR